MKAKVKLALPGFAGNMNDLVIYCNRQLDKLIARKKAIPPVTPDPGVMKDAFALARRISLSDAFKQDCRSYIRAYNTHFRRNGYKLSAWSNVWLRILRGLLKREPEVELRSLSRSDLHALGCGSISSAVDSGLLDKVPGYASMASLI
ncbi:MAG TPA: hypothetical protein PL020_01115 [Candidatus Cloacimonadota bacterium]|nr:hypothetical protein [Candidatus Cloacimonadota bacterium]